MVTSRDRALAAVQRRLARARDNPAAALGAEADAELDELMRLVPDPSADQAAVEAVGWLFWARYQVLPDGPDRRVAMMSAGAFLTNAYRATPEKIPYALRLPSADSPQRLIEQAVALATRYEANPDVALLHEAIGLYRRALATMSADDPYRGVCCQQLSAALRFDGRPDAVAESVKWARAALAATPEGHEYHLDRLQNLSQACLALYDRTGDDDALNDAVAFGRQAVAGADGHTLRGTLLLDLCRVLQKAFQHNGNVAALKEAVQLARLAMTEPADETTGIAGLLSHLGVDLQYAYEQRGAGPEVVSQAVRTGRDAVATAQPDDPDRHMYLGNLSTALRMRYDLSGDVEPLLEALEIGREAVAATPPDSPYRATYQSNLAGVLMTWFHLREDTDALAESVHMGRAALAATPPDHPQWLGRANNLSLALRALFYRTSDVDVLNEAVHMIRDALAADPGHPGRPSILLNLSATLEALAGHTRDVGTMTESVQAARESVAAAATDADRAMTLNSLCATLRTLFTWTRDPDTLREAVQTGKDAAAAMRADDPERARCLLNLGFAARSLAESTGTTDALADARAAFTEAAGLDVAPVRLRVSAYWGLARTHEAVDQALNSYEQAVILLQQLVPRAMSHGDRVQTLGDMSALPAEAASAAIAAGRPGRALELLEQGRATLLAESVGARRDLAELQAQAPDLAERFVQLRAALDEPGPRDARQRHHMAGEWQSLLDRIRSVPGMANFLRAPSLEDLRHPDGPVVVLNMSRLRIDALIVTPGDPVRVVPLTGLDPLESARRTADFIVATQILTSPGRSTSDTQTARKTVTDVLAWVWDEITSPVLAELGLAQRAGDVWPRVWWCPVGTLAYLPLHAAGRHSGPDALSVLDCVVSSYTPTVSALRQGSGHRSPAKALIVAVPDAPGATPLPGAAAEADVLTRLLPEANLLIGPQATRAAVMAALPRHEVVHLACHGQSAWDMRAGSKLLLHDHNENPLTISALSRLRLTGAELAYLGACSTTSTHPSLVNEAVHITAAFQIAGYRNVIGTLWSINDALATWTAHTVYSLLTKDGGLDTTQAAHALHQATRQLRDTYPDDPLLWAAHIHVGP